MSTKNPWGLTEQYSLHYPAVGIFLLLKPRTTTFNRKKMLLEAAAWVMLCVFITSWTDARFQPCTCEPFVGVWPYLWTWLCFFPVVCTYVWQEHAPEHLLTAAYISTACAAWGAFIVVFCDDSGTLLTSSTASALSGSCTSWAALTIAALRKHRST